MKVALHIVLERRERLAGLLQSHQYLPLAELCARLGISEATARRDLAALARDKTITRTYGGAVCEYNQRFTSFRERQATAAPAKRRVARAALKLLRPGARLFLDGGTTLFLAAEEIVRSKIRPLTVVTNNLPAADLLADADGVEVHLLGGRYLRRQSILLGDCALGAMRAWEFELALLGAEGMTARGLWNSQDDVVRTQRGVIKRAARSLFCLDAGKLGREAATFLLPWPAVDRLVTDADPEALTGAGIRLAPHQLIAA